MQYNYIRVLSLKQIQIEAYDSAYPLNKATEYIQITVNRNANPPAFTQNDYEKTISENYPLVSEVVQVAAADPDGVSSVMCRFVLTGYYL